MRWSWVNFQCRGVLLVWVRVGQGPTALAVGAGGGCLDIFTLIYPFSSLSPSLWETTRYRLKYCLKGSLSPKTTNQPTTNIVSCVFSQGIGDAYNRDEQGPENLQESDDVAKLTIKQVNTVNRTPVAQTGLGPWKLAPANGSSSYPGSVSI